MSDAGKPDLFAALTALEKQAGEAGGAARVARQHQAGKLTARERIALFCDPDSFIELDKLVTHRSTDFGLGDNKILGDGVITGYGTVHGRTVFLFAQDHDLAKLHRQPLHRLGQQLALHALHQHLFGIRCLGGDVLDLLIHSGCHLVPPILL